jgi:hypothetical protein
MKLSAKINDAVFCLLTECRAKVIDAQGRFYGASVASTTRHLLQDWLGHRAIQHTARYTELTPTRFKDVWR